ncbi:MAG TPA: amidase family protein [Amycolatopsis sp.]|nr:amidase family protein [Amycolatopsis sp.]
MDGIDAVTVAKHAAQAGVELRPGEDAVLAELVADVGSMIDLFDQLPAAEPVASGVRDPGRAPSRDEDPLNAVIRRISVRRRSGGRLAGRRVGVKDTIAVAGVPMTAGSIVLADFVPERDATVVERLLDEGAELVAKLNMDGFAWSGGADTGDYGKILNPADLAYSTCGSSGGTAAALAYEWVDLTLGTDQAGSNRLPASWCGVLGMKPTFGLVPYTGVMSVDPTIDHVGPMATNVSDLALLLDVIAGRDADDPRQARTPDLAPDAFCAAVEDTPATLAGVRIGVLQEGFSSILGVPQEVTTAIKEVAQHFRKLGADVVEVSVPEHPVGGPLAFAFYCESQLNVLTSGGNGYGWSGRYATDLPVALGKALAAASVDLPITLKTVLVAGMMLRERANGAYYARAQNLRPWLRAGYDRALRTVDALLLPTSTVPPQPHVDETDVVARTRRGWSMLGNTPGTDITGHPAVSIPAAQIDGLPVGAMLIGRHFDDAGLLRLARAYERDIGWQLCPPQSW